MAESDTHNRSKAPIDERTRMTKGSAQWLLEKDEDRDAPVYHANNLDVYICGEQAFVQIAADLKAAKHTVEIVCWGFDPAMELIRVNNVWPRGDTWGGLLRDVAAGKYNGGKPVQVRILCWRGVVGSAMSNNMPGFSSGRLTYEERMAVAVGSAGGTYMPGLDGGPVTPQERREDFNAKWYQDAFGGRIANLSVRTRDGDSKAVTASLKGEKGRRGFIEDIGLTELATDHQKTILIDYEHEGGHGAVGYVMGLNSVTDYWDTQEHLFYDPRRGESWEGANDEEPGLKPYQDYACRIRGEALVRVSKNFVDAWNRAGGKGAAVSRSHDVRNPPAGLAKGLQQPHVRTQIVRTQPEEQEKTIKRLYKQATSFARHCVYVENQYFQNTDWATELREGRTAFLQGLQAAGKSPSDAPDLHVIAVIPTPERKQMVPRTYDTVKVLGYGTSMPNQDKMIEDELARHRAQQAAWDAHVKKQQAAGQAPDPDMYPAPLSPLAQSAQALGEKATIAKALDGLGMRTLVASLWTFDRTMRNGKPARASRYREIYIHSKLMLIDDSFFTIGSANLNLRSMAVDAEINMATDDPEKAADLRQRAWDVLTGQGSGCNPASLAPAEMKRAFRAWGQLASQNALAKTGNEALHGFVTLFHDERTSAIRVG